jgi:hypothetical protein
MPGGAGSLIPVDIDATIVTALRGTRTHVRAQARHQITASTSGKLSCLLSAMSRCHMPVNSGSGRSAGLTPTASTAPQDTARSAA